MFAFSLIIPVFNEGKNITNLVYEIYDSLKNHKDFEVILVNDYSNDNTLLEIDELKSNFPIKIINNKKNYGQSYSIKEGISKSKYDIIITIDGDGQNNPKDIPSLLKVYFNNNEIKLVGGIRNKRKDSNIKLISSKIANTIRSNVLKDNCQDTGCSLKVFDKRIFLNFPFFDGIHRFLPALFKGYGYKTTFINVDHRPRLYGKSNYGTVGRLFKGVLDLIRVVIIVKKFKRNRD
tara:strand:+ start:87 stop:788 length:702 start_codon:yes stop_codon:yes gene_type:complete